MLRVELVSKSILAVCISFGISTTTGPGLPEVEISKAALIVAANLSSSVIRKHV
ncbi:MAG: hypothetical protein CM1200mP17_16920 [Woeseia sp.]|nr:MAG: hypothetical protein CM1200mP17_16920 [Woeseia sp.]